MKSSTRFPKPAIIRRVSFHLLRAGGLCFAAIVLLAGCGPKPAAGLGGPEGPLEVGVITVATAPVKLTQELPGRVSARRVAEVRARVTGIVEKRLFDEGSEVKEGQMLYEIDPAPYQAALESAKGTLARAEANAATARLKEERYKQLLAARTIAKQDYDDALANQKSFDADILAGQAAVQMAEINLSYTKVNSPIGGRIGISQVTEGAYVQQTAATLLATVQELDTVYVNVTQSSGELLRLKRELASGQLKADASGHAKVRLVLEDGTPYPEEGTFELADVTVNESTSSVIIRATFPNPRRDLLPGMFVRARLDEGTSPDAILVPQSAVTRNSKGEPTALVVGANRMAELRVLQTPRTVGDQWLVTSGLKPGDRVIVTNLQRVRPGVTVKPSQAAPSPATAAAGR